MTAPTPRRGLVTLAAALVLALASASHARFEWRDVVQRFELRADGSVVVADERTLWTDEDFGEAFVCVRLAPGQRLELLPTAGAVSPGPDARALTQPCADGTEVVIRQERRVRERRVRFDYRLLGTVDAYADVVQWYWNALEADHPGVRGYRLEVVAPGGMAAPHDAYVMRYDNPEEPRVALTEDRSLLTVAFDRVPSGSGVEVRWFMPPALFTVPATDEEAFERLLLDQERIVREARGRWAWYARRAHAAWGLLPALALGWLTVGAFGAWRRVGREPRVDAMRYPFEPPSALPPAVVTTLLDQHAPTSGAGRAWFATIMDLARRGYLAFEGEGRHLTLRLEPESRGTGELEAFERATLDYLGRAAGAGRSGLRDPRSVSVAELETYGRSHAQAFLAGFGRAIRSWGEGYFGGPYTTAESRGKRNRWVGRAAVVAIGCGLLAAALAGTAAELAVGGAVLAVVVLLVIAVAMPAWREDVAAERAGWLGFRRTLTDHTRMRDAPSDFFVLWDRYYVYAASLGVAERFLRTLARAAPAAGESASAMAARGSWMGAAARSGDFAGLSRSVSQISSSLARAGASASSGGSSSGGGGGGGGGSSGGR